MVLSLRSQACGTEPMQGTEQGACDSRHSAQSSSTELRAAPPKLKGALMAGWYALMGLCWASIPTPTLTATNIHRPTVLIRGCIPKGYLARHLSE